MTSKTRVRTDDRRRGGPATARGRLAGWAVILAALFAGACSDHLVYANTALLEIRLDPDSVVVGAIGRQLQLTVEARDVSGRPAQPQLLAWDSEDPQIVSVDSDGRITAHRDGSALVTVETGSHRASARIVVKATVWNSAEISVLSNEDTDPRNNADSTWVQVFSRDRPTSR